MKGFKRYERYKDSGVEWIGEIPEHWNLSRFKNYIKLINEKVESNELDLHYVGLENIESFTGKLIEGASYIGEGVSIIFTPKDVLFGKLRPYLAKVLLPSFNGRCSTELLVLRPIDNSLVDRSYLYYYCLSDGFINIVNSSTYGARMPRTSWDFISLLTLTLPSLHEQKAIAIFLNQKTAEIDSLIADKEKLIELLQEQRQAIITLAVTKGLDPNVPLKDSGIEWLGEIPEHWNCIRMKYICDINPSKSELKASSNTKITFLSMENISEEGILNLQEERELAEVYNGFTYFRENDVIVAKITPCFENGKVAICKGLTNGLGFGTTELHVLRAKNIVYAEYIYLVIQSHIFRNMGTALMKGAAGQKRVPTEFIQNFTIGIPPMNEQKDIINYVKQKSS